MCYRKLYNDEFCTLILIKYDCGDQNKRWRRWAGCVEQMGDMSYAHSILAKIYEGHRPLVDVTPLRVKQ